MKNKIQIAIIIIALISLSGCTLFSRDGSDTQLTTVGQAGTQVTTAQLEATDIDTFINKNAASLLTAKERNEAASAQFYALQFGRVGAPRVWQGETGATGRVFVGPYVRVNLLNCRQFSHSITIKGTIYEREGTACREADGRWDVVDS